MLYDYEVYVEWYQIDEETEEEYKCYDWINLRAYNDDDVEDFVYEEYGYEATFAITEKFIDEFGW